MLSDMNTKTVFFTGYNGKKYRLEQVPRTAKVRLERLNDKVDGESTLLMVSDGDQTIATFSSIVSFYVSDLNFVIEDGSKDFI